MKTGRAVRALEGHTNVVSSVAFSPDGESLASGSGDNNLRLWEVKTGRLIRSLDGNLGAVYAVSFAPHGKYLNAAGSAGRLQLRDVETGDTFLYRYSFGAGEWLDLLPDGRFNASPEGMRYLCYTEREALSSFTAESLVKEFYDPQGVQDAGPLYRSAFYSLGVCASLGVRGQILAMVLLRGLQTFLIDIEKIAPVRNSIGVVCLVCRACS